ncbi:MAG: hypothetical protein PVF70_00855 [Anaerolineales bacterium]|jgi:hypothetical protein
MSELVEKLCIQPGQRIMIINPPQGYLEALGKLPNQVQLLNWSDGTLDLVHLFVHNISELVSLAPMAVEAVKFDGLLWISYPKESSKLQTDITREKGWDNMTEAGFRSVTQISIDDTWSAVRFRPSDQIEK